MKKILIGLIFASGLTFTTVAHANWFFTALRTLGSTGMKTLDVTSKVTSIAGALDAMRYRRRDTNFITNSLRYENGNILLEEEYIPLGYQDKKTADEFRRSAWSKAKSGQHLSAKILYEQSLSFDANNSNTWHGYGWTLSELEQFDAATNAFTTAIYINNYSDNLNHESESWRYLGWNYQRQGYPKEAKLSYQESLAVNPNNRQAKVGLNSINRVAIPSAHGSKKYRISAKSGLRLRSSPSTKGYIIELLPYEGEVNLLRYKGSEIKIGGVTGRWAQIKYQEKIGFVFGAHLEKLGQIVHTNRQPPHTININHTRSTSNKNSNHFHGQRNHSHPIPRVGIAHRHNNGPEGSDVGTSSQRMRSSTELSEPTRSITNNFIIQAGAFSTNSNAKKHLTSLKNAGYRATITKRSSSGRQLYYVEFIGFKSMGEAQSAKKQIASMNPKGKFFAKKL